MALRLSCDRGRALARWLRRTLLLTYLLTPSSNEVPVTCRQSKMVRRQARRRRQPRRRACHANGRLRQREAQAPSQPRQREPEAGPDSDPTESASGIIALKARATGPASNGTSDPWTATAASGSRSYAPLTRSSGRVTSDLQLCQLRQRSEREASDSESSPLLGAFAGAEQGKDSILLCQ